RGLRLVIAPRHVNRVDEIKNLVRDAGENCYLKSEFDNAPDKEFSDKRVIIVDTVGDLAEIYRVATIAFVGGSLVQYGGHNMLEPAALGIPVVVGPNTDNFADVVELLRGAEALTVVRDRQELQKTCRGFLDDDRLRAEVGDRGIKAIEGAKGANRKHLDVLARFTGAAVPEKPAGRGDARPLAAATAARR
ncbi:MAG: 3-deoxy-D-manno-octulosonic acid transferase, partial [Planctomycetota bacterium]